jgi:hypothetical protein
MQYRATARRERDAPFVPSPPRGSSKGCPIATTPRTGTGVWRRGGLPARAAPRPRRRKPKWRWHYMVPARLPPGNRSFSTGRIGLSSSSPAVAFSLSRVRARYRRHRPPTRRRLRGSPMTPHDVLGRPPATSRPPRKTHGRHPTAPSAWSAVVVAGGRGDAGASRQSGGGGTSRRLGGRYDRLHAGDQRLALVGEATGGRGGDGRRPSTRDSGACSASHLRPRFSDRIGRAVAFV